MQKRQLKILIELKKVIVLAYFFPPCNLTASQRVYSWAKDFKKSGIYPIIITRKWERPVNTWSDISFSTSDGILHEKKEDYEVYYLPFKGNLKDRIYARYGDTKWVRVRKFLSFFELILQNFINSIIPFSNFYKFSKEYLKQNPDIKTVLISGNPFILFKFGYLLKKHFKVNWLADYRDAWTTSEINTLNKNFLYKFLQEFESSFEKKWVSTASVVTSTSTPLANGISKLINIQAATLYNGFNKEDFIPFSGLPKFKKFTITYVGTLYEGQEIEIFCSAYKKFIQLSEPVNCELLFPGLGFDEQQTKRIEANLSGFEKYYSISERVNRDRILEIEKRSHLLLHVAWKGFEGVIASKIYEYIASGTFILVTPSDNGEIQNIISESQCGVCTDTIDETVQLLIDHYKKFLRNETPENNIETVAVNKFSRKTQTEKLANLLREL